MFFKKKCKQCNDAKVSNGKDLCSSCDSSEKSDVRETNPIIKKFLEIIMSEGKQREMYDAMLHPTAVAFIRSLAASIATQVFNAHEEQFRKAPFELTDGLLSLFKITASYGYIICVAEMLLQGRRLNQDIVIDRSIFANEWTCLNKGNTKENILALDQHVSQAITFLFGYRVNCMLKETPAYGELGEEVFGAIRAYMLEAMAGGYWAGVAQDACMKKESGQ